MTTIKVGDKFKTNEGYEVEVVEYNGCLDILVKFDLPRSYIGSVRSYNLRRGMVGNQYHPSLYGVGYIGIGSHKPKEGGRFTKEYTVWNSMIKRCYNPKSQEKHPSYIGVEVDPRFHCFQNFASWCQDQVGFRESDWQLDKDILVKGNRIYSPETCVFVPREVNMLLVKNEAGRGDLPIGVSWFERDKKYAVSMSMFGKRQFLGRYNTPAEAFHVYKEVKEAHIKDIAEKYVDVLDQRAYNALIAYTVELSD